MLKGFVPSAAANASESSSSRDVVTVSGDDQEPMCLVDGEDSSWTNACIASYVLYTVLRNELVLEFGVTKLHPEDFRVACLNIESLCHDQTAWRGETECLQHVDARGH